MCRRPCSVGVGGFSGRCVTDGGGDAFHWFSVCDSWMHGRAGRVHFSAGPGEGGGGGGGGLVADVARIVCDVIRS